MAGELRRRGPDGGGLQQWSTAVLGHRRLAILDLSERGRQPMLSEDGSVGLVFNGAIYNFIELRQELAAHGFEFRSDSDTEVLLHGFRHWGIDELTRRLAGMFAFAIWDDRSRELFLVRDRLGVKPLVYAESGETLAFASTTRALRSAGLGSELDEQAVIDFLEWGVVPEERSIYRGLHKLPPATIAHWRDGRLETQCYWKPPVALPSGKVSFEEAVERTEALLLVAAKRRTRADVPIGSLLSGGVDSALVCWALREAGSDVNAYSFSAPGEPEDESADARLTAQELGIPLSVLESDSTHDDWSDFVDAYAEPFACGSALGMLRLSRAAREAVTVLITGDGGDDVFLGYPQHRFLHTAQQLARHTPTSLAEMGLALGMRPPVSGPGHRARNYAGYVFGGLGAFLRVRPVARYFATHELLGSRLRGEPLRPASQSVGIVPGSGRSVLDDYLEHARGHQFVAEYLSKVDGATMYFGLEARSPFLDHELWEYAAALPYSVRLQGNQLKAVLRAIASKRISPRVAAGRKRGFEVPVGSWLQGRWKPRTEELLADSLLSSEGWLEGGRLLELSRSGSIPELNLWYAVVLEAWLRREASAIPAALASER
jgi:asparagine synthase (glutamine-hydrolysing)